MLAKSLALSEVKQQYTWPKPLASKVGDRNFMPNEADCLLPVKIVSLFF